MLKCPQLAQRNEYWKRAEARTKSAKCFRKARLDNSVRMGRGRGGGERREKLVAGKRGLGALPH